MKYLYPLIARYRALPLIVFFALVLAAWAFLVRDSSHAQTATGTIKIVSIGETGTAESAPYVNVWVNSQSPALRTATFSSLSSGTHTVSTKDVIGLVETAGVCTYAIGGTECTVTTFNLTPSCDLTSCSIPVSVTGGQVTKVAFKYQGVYEGFGASTTGGRNGTIYRVTNLNDSGPGSLRDALSANNRHIVFDVAGDIVLNSALTSSFKNITVDGFTAPAPGITIKRHTVVFTNRWDTRNPDPQNIIVRGLRFQINNVNTDNFYWALTFLGVQSTPISNIVIDHNSISRAVDDQLTLSNVRDATVSWNVISDPGSTRQNFYLGDKSERVSVHHNFFAPKSSLPSIRNPQLSYHAADRNEITSGPATIQGDIRNNLMHMGMLTDGAPFATWVYAGSKANVINNYYVGVPGVENTVTQMKAAIVICGKSQSCAGTCSSCGGTPITAESSNAAAAWVDGNIVRPVWTVDHNSYDLNATSPIYDQAPITQTDAFTAACHVLNQAGVWPLDAHDQPFYTNAKNDLAARAGACPVSSPSPSPSPSPTPTPESFTFTASPSSVSPGSTITVTVSGGPGNRGDWVGMYLVGQPNNTLDWKYLSNTQSHPATGLTSASLTFTAPQTPETYEFRFFPNDTLNVLQISNPVTVTSTGPTPTPTPTPTPSSPPSPSPLPIACHLYTPGTSVPTGFGVPWDVFSANELLIRATCQDLTDATLDFGRGVSTQYIYNTGYHYHAGMSGWMSMSLTSTEALISGAWYPRTATATLTGMDLVNTTHYALGYLCTWTGSQWQCGCRDSACTQSYWQIQSFKR